MTDITNNWDVLEMDKYVLNDNSKLVGLEKLNDKIQKQPSTASTRKAEDWLGLLSDSEDMVYEPTVVGNSNVNRRNNLKKHGTHRTSRSEGLLFDNDDNIVNIDNDISSDIINTERNKRTISKNDINSFDFGVLPDVNSTKEISETGKLTTLDTISKRRDTSPSITFTKDLKQKSKIKSDRQINHENMPSWLSGLIQQNEKPNLNVPNDNLQEIKKIQSLDITEKNIINENSSILSLLKGKEKVQSTVLELVQELLQKKHDIQQATITLIQDQQNRDLLIKALILDNPGIHNADEQQLENLKTENKILQLTIDHTSKKNELELDALKTKFELELDALREKLSRYEIRINELEEERKNDAIERKENEKLLKQSYEDRLKAIRSSVMEEQRKLAEERFEVISERYRLETLMKLDFGTESDFIKAKAEFKQNLEDLKKREKDLEKRVEHIEEQEKHLAETKCKIQEQDDEVKKKSIRAEKLLKMAMVKQEEGLKSLEIAKEIQSKFERKGYDIHKRLLEVIKREENVLKEESKLVTEKDQFDIKRKKLDLILPHLSADDIYLHDLRPIKRIAEKDVKHRKLDYSNVNITY
ncbi:centromere-associated protein E-like isoform X6 [Daktulosphaira vitifoliae]|uniref:centromere-associated protein E-like isoform X6 n=1 Tax=Daktulosphaira vitifoliae TaxID=58002 RepID=UPI0021AA5814|nr:centromere-associated protein E-like isoform X6 [Daktulosphaira vitifoliae]